MKFKSILLTAVATLGLTAATMAQNVPSYVPTNGLVGWWPFNGNANDESGNGNNGNVNGATLTSDRFGNSNKAYSFDGVSNDIQVPSTGQFTTNSITINGWLKIQNIISSGIQFIVNGNQSSASWSILYNNLGFGGIINQNCSGPNVNNFGQTPSANQWINITYVITPSTISFYKNGNFITSQNNVVFASSCGNNNLYFGRDIVGNQEYYSGSLDDIGIWNRALNQQEITDLYNGNICYQNITVTDTLLINMGITGFNPVTYNNTIKIFPNPTNDHITIDYGNFASLNGYQLKIENSLGQQVFQTNVTQQSDYLSLTNWGGNGLYFVRIIDPQGNTIDIRKIVIQ